MSEITTAFSIFVELYRGGFWSDSSYGTKRRNVPKIELIPSDVASKSHDGSFEPDRFEHRQHRWADGDAGKQNTSAVHDDSELGTFFFGKRFDHLFNILFSKREHSAAMVLAEGIKLSFKSVGQFGQPFTELWKLREVLCHGRRIEIEILAEIRAALRRKIFQREESRADQVNGALEPLTIFVLVFVAPELCRFQFGFHVRQQIPERHCADVLGVHPDRLVVGPVFRIVLVKVKYRIRAVNSIERKFLDKFLKRIDLSFFAGRPAKQC